LPFTVDWDLIIINCLFARFLSRERDWHELLP
jgi:hypothetical protein